MMPRSSLPAPWSEARAQRFDDLIEAIKAYELYAAALARIGINTGPLIVRRDELRDHIVNVLGPAFRDS